MRLLSGGSQILRSKSSHCKLLPIPKLVLPLSRLRNHHPPILSHRIAHRSSPPMTSLLTCSNPPHHPPTHLLNNLHDSSKRLTYLDNIQRPRRHSQANQPQLSLVNRAHRRTRAPLIYSVSLRYRPPKTETAWLPHPIHLHKRATNGPTWVPSPPSARRR